MTRRRDVAGRPTPYAVRIGDADRDRASEDLAAHYADGRLEHEEYAERLDAIWSSRTRGDLVQIFADLPQRVAPPPAQAGNPYRRPRSGGFPWLPAMLLLVAASILLDAPLWLLVVPLWMLWRRKRHHHATRHLMVAGPQRRHH